MIAGLSKMTFVGRDLVAMSTILTNVFGAREVYSSGDQTFSRSREKFFDLSGLDVPPPRPRGEGEGRSIYFYDQDNHLFELATGTLAERPARYAKGRGGLA